MKELKFNIKYFLSKKDLYFMIIAMLLIIFINIYITIDSSINYYSEVASSSLYQTIIYKMNWLAPFMMLLIPILSALIFADVTWVEENEKIQNLLFVRLSYKKNVIVRCILSVLFVFIIVFVSLSLEYILLSIIYGVEPFKTGESDLSFLLNVNNNAFLDLYRVTSPNLYVFINIFHFSVLYGLLSGLVYSIAFFIKKRALIYFSGSLLILFFMIVTEALNIPQLGFIYQAQWSLRYNVVDIVILSLILLAFIIIPLIIHLRKKDKFI